MIWVIDHEIICFAKAIMNVEGKGNIISNDTNVSMLPLSMEDEPMKDLGTQFSQRTIDFVNDRIQAIMSQFFMWVKIDLLYQHQLDALDKVVKVFGRTTKSIFNPRITPKAIGLPRAVTNISSIQGHVNRTRFGHGRPWRREDILVTMKSNMTKPSTITKASTKVLWRPKNTRGKNQQENVARKWKRVEFPKVF